MRMRTRRATHPSPPSFQSSLVLWTNCPTDPDEPFGRHVYRSITGGDGGTVDGDWQAYVDIHAPGAFEYFVEFGAGGAPTDAWREGAPRRTGPVSRFVVQPDLVVNLLRRIPSPGRRREPPKLGSQEDPDSDGSEGGDTPTALRGEAGGGHPH